MNLIETFLAGLWRKKARAYLVDSRSHERPGIRLLRDSVRGVEGPAK